MTLQNFSIFKPPPLLAKSWLHLWVWEKALCLFVQLFGTFEGREKCIYVKSIVTWFSSLTASDLSFKNATQYFCNKNVTYLLLVHYYAILW